MSYKDNKFFIRFLSFASILLSPLIIMLGWNWFIHPLGVVSINYIWAFGIELFFSYILYKEPIYALSMKRDKNHKTDVVINNLVYQAVTLIAMFLMHIDM